MLESPLEAKLLAAIPLSGRDEVALPLVRVLSAIAQLLLGSRLEPVAAI